MVASTTPLQIAPDMGIIFVIMIADLGKGVC
jgi:hypothetical protein